MKSRHSQTGSAHVIIIVLIVALLGVLGFVFWQNFMNKPASTQTSAAQTAPQTPTGKTLTVSEWGVKGTYNVTSSTPGYTYDAGSDSISLTASGLPSGCGGLNGVGTIERYKSDAVFPNSNGQTAASYYNQNVSPYQAHVGNYYYLFNAPTAPCSPDGGAVQTALLTATEQIVSSLQAQ